VITKAKNPKWIGANHDAIRLETEQNGEWVEFTARPTDCEDHGKMLYHFSINGIFGEIADSDEELILAGDLPVPEGYEVQDGKLIYIAYYEQLATAELNRRLAPFNSEEAKAIAETDPMYAAERKAQMAELLSVKKQPGWPVTVKWPDAG